MVPLRRVIYEGQTTRLGYRIIYEGDYVAYNIPSDFFEITGSGIANYSPIHSPGYGGSHIGYLRDGYDYNGSDLEGNQHSFHVKYLTVHEPRLLVKVKHERKRTGFGNFLIAKGL